MTVTITTQSLFVSGATGAQTQGTGQGHQMLVVSQPDPSITVGVATPSKS